MPTYEYECKVCNYKFEKFQMMTAGPIKKCPKCNSKVRRLIGKGGGIIFKGPGFYATDYRKPKPIPKPLACGETKPCPNSTCSESDKNKDSGKSKKE